MPNSNRLTIRQINEISSALVAARTFDSDSVAAALPPGFELQDIHAWTPRHDPPTRAEVRFLLQRCARRKSDAEQPASQSTPAPDRHRGALDTQEHG